VSEEGHSQVPSDSYVQSFARGLAVIRAFGPERAQMTLSEVAAVAGLTRAGARRILLTLVQLGYVAQEERRFSLTPRILELGYAYLSGTPLWNLALPYMEEVAESTRESCSVSVLDGTDIVYILRLSTHKVMSINLAVGSRLPAWVTSMGRVLLAGLPAPEQDRLLADSRIQAYTPSTLTDVGCSFWARAFSSAFSLSALSAGMSGGRLTCISTMYSMVSLLVGAACGRRHRCAGPGPGGISWRTSAAGR
jgi:IclR family pca regulon transcriptional regulator